MGLNTSKGNMYDFVTHTWNTVKGECPHDCAYCYMKRWGHLRPARFDEKELRTDLGSGNFIFVGSGNDLFADGTPDAWITRTLDHCDKFDNRYLFQSKNPARILRFINHPVFEKSVVCTTIESDGWYGDFMGHAPNPTQRSFAMGEIADKGVPTYVTIEPIMEFNIVKLVRTIRRCNPQQVNIGADTGNSHLPEPSKDELVELIAALEEFTTIKQKSNLKRLLK